MKKNESYVFMLMHTVRKKAKLFTFSYLSVEKLLYLGQIFEMEILMDLHVLRSPESENHIFSKWSVCLCVYLLSA